MKKNLIFDCYQTLIYKKNLEKIVQRFLAEELHVRMPLKHIRRAFGIIYERYKFRHPRFASAQDRRNFYIKYNKELMGILGLEISDNSAAALNEMFRDSTYICYPDVLAVLRFYKNQKKYPLGIIANWTKPLEDILERLKIKSYFNFIYCSDSLGVEKPNPEIFEKALKNMPSDCEKIFYIGDDYELDVIPARQAGLTPILIDRKNSYPKKVDCVKIKSLKELKKIIK